MTISFLDEPEEIMANHVSEHNPDLPTLTANDINIRRVTALTLDRWLTAVDNNMGEYVSGYPSAKMITPPNWGSRDHAGFVARKDVTFQGGVVDFHIRSDNSYELFIDGVSIATGNNYKQTFVHQVDLAAGVHEIVIASFEDTGGAGLGFAIVDGNTTIVSDTTWPVIEYTGQEPIDYTGEIYETTADIDMKIYPSEAFGDYVNFRYRRIPIEKVFGTIDEDTGTTVVEVLYPIDDIQMLSGNISNFDQIYQNWYRFSHGPSGVYPEDETELEGWSYISDYDVIQSTINSETHVGFISDDVSDNYLFNTVVTSSSNDDDGIHIVLAAKKQGEIDDDEHTLTINLTAGFNGKQERITIWDQYIHTSGLNIVGDPLIVVDPNTERPGWRRLYGHVYAIRNGNQFTIWTKQYLDESLNTADDAIRDPIILQHVSDLSALKEDDLDALGYFKTEFDVSVIAPKYVGPCHYGYSQLSQPNARFWNIRRPNDVPEVTPELKQYFIDTFGFNMGNNGISVENLGANKFQVTFDNVLYKGDLTMLPY